MIATFERLKKDDDKQKGNDSTENKFYMKQTDKLDNACGIIACLHSVLNNLDSIQLEVGSILDKF